MVAPGEETDITVGITAPSKPGRYVSYWRLSQTDGSRFGQRVWADIVVATDTPTGNSQAVAETQTPEVSDKRGPVSAPPEQHKMEVENPPSSTPMESTTTLVDPIPQVVPTPSAPPMEVFLFSLFSHHFCSLQLSYQNLLSLLL